MDRKTRLINMDTATGGTDTATGGTDTAMGGTDTATVVSKKRI